MKRQTSSDPKPVKRVRIQDPHDDLEDLKPTNNVEFDLESCKCIHEYCNILARRKKGAVNTQGFDSDQEAEGSEDSDQEPTKSHTTAHDDGMFGEEEKPAKKYMDRHDIQGQEWNADTKDYTDDGSKIEPFNMDQELEDGKFDESGHYIRDVDEHKIHDSWMQGVSKGEIEKVSADSTLLMVG